MRSVPHRVVCLLGLDDGAFPRKAPRDGDDLMLDDPHIGERDPRSEDRQLLLDALLAATERLIVTYTGNDERTNTPRPPAVPVGELLDVVDATVRCADGELGPQADRHPPPAAAVRPAQLHRRGATRRAGAVELRSPSTLDGAQALAGPRTRAAAVPGRAALPRPATGGRARRSGALRRASGPGLSAPATRDRPVSRRRRDRGRAAGRARRTRALGRRPAAARGAAGAASTAAHGDHGRDRPRDAAARASWASR